MQQSAIPGNSIGQVSKTTHSLSCTNCRQRKVKCNKISPCNHCVRLQVECSFPRRKKNEKRKVRRQDDLLDRLARLESIVGKVQTTTDRSPPQPVQRPLRGSTEPHEHDRDRDDQSHAGASDSGERAPTEPRNRYVSHDFWSNLCSEVEGLKQALEQPIDSEDEGEEGSTPRSQLSSGNTQSGSGDTPVSYAVLGSSVLPANCDVLAHPHPNHISFLCSTYFTNVDALFRVLHRPTTKAALDRFARHPHGREIERITEALFFAMYFAAVTSLSPAACLSLLGEERSILLSRYQLATEIALARADYLNSSRLESVQALAIYIACLRSDNKSRASWALIALAVRCAQALDLHHEPGPSVSVFEAELRRRIWWGLVIMDVRAVEDRGTEPITPGFPNTRLPHNVNDDTFGPDTTTPLVDADGPTDMSFALATARCSGIFLDLCNDGRGYKTGDMQIPALPGDGENELLSRVRTLEALFVDTADPSHAVSCMAALAVRMVTLKMWLSLQYPFRVRGANGASMPRPKVSHEDMLRASVAVLELAESAYHRPDAERFMWWFVTYVQWHPLSVALAELCTHPVGPLTDRAWAVIDRTMPLWSEQIADTKAGALWQPIRKLLRKAKEARVESQLKALGLGQDMGYKAPASGTATLPASREIGMRDFLSNPVAAGPDMQLIDQMVPPTDLPFSGALDWPRTSSIQQGQRQDLAMADDMDWSAWNEFVTESFGGLEMASGMANLRTPFL